MLSQKHNAKYASRIGTLASSTARAGTSFEMIRQKTKSTSSPFLISSLSRTFTSGRADHTVTGTGRKKVLEKTILQINSKRSAGNEDTRTFTIDLFVTHGSEKPCWNWIVREEVIREMDKLANEDHTHIATEEELNVYRGNWWIRSNFVGSDTMPIRHRPDFKQALSTLHHLKKAEDEADYQNWWQSSSSPWWHWQDFWWHPSPETSPRWWTWHWSNGETFENQWIVYLLVEWVSQRIWCTIYSDYFGNSQRSSLTPTGCVKSTSPTTENWLRKLYISQHEQQHERWGQAWHKLHQQQVHEHLHAQVAQPVSTALRARSFVTPLDVCVTCTS